MFFSVASVLEQRNAKRVRPRGALSPRLMVDLLKRPGFVGALVVNALGSVLQVVALHFGSLAVVQPLVVLNLLFAVVIAAVTARRRPPDAKGVEEAGSGLRVRAVIEGQGDVARPAQAASAGNHARRSGASQVAAGSTCAASATAFAASTPRLRTAVPSSKMPRDAVV